MVRIAAEALLEIRPDTLCTSQSVLKTGNTAGSFKKDDMTQALIPLADGVEEMEAVILADVLRRADWTVVTAGIAGDVVTAARGTRLVSDRNWKAIEPMNFDALVIPGGAGGVSALRRFTPILDAVKSFMAEGRLVAAVCAAPLILMDAGVLAGRRFTAHPAVFEELPASGRSSERVVVDGRLVTSRAPGTCFEFALSLISLVDGPDKARTLAGAMLVKE